MRSAAVRPESGHAATNLHRVLDSLPAKVERQRPAGSPGPLTSDPALVSTIQDLGDLELLLQDAATDSALHESIIENGKTQRKQPKLKHGPSVDNDGYRRPKRVPF
jgi:hypothetical protein